MPVTTHRNDLIAAIQASLHSYWQIRAANALTIRFGQGPWVAMQLQFGNIPITTHVQPPPQVSVNVALQEIDSYVKGGRATTDYFFTLISHFELFLSQAIVLKGGSPDGTLGKLMVRAGQLYGLPVCAETELADEVRERRNVLIHHFGAANQRYLNAASCAALPAHIQSTLVGQILNIDDDYLAYVSDVLISYSLLF